MKNDLLIFMDKIRCFGQNNVLINTDKKVKIYFECNSKEVKLKANIILLSGFEDALDLDVLRKIISPKTTIVSPYDISEKLGDLNVKTCLIGNNESAIIDGIKIVAYPSYILGDLNILDKQTYNGYLVKGEESETTYYFAGPTSLLPEMNLIESDVAFIPVDGDGMDLFESLAASNVIQTKEFVPITYSQNEAEALISCNRFKLKCPYKTELYRK